MATWGSKEWKKEKDAEYKSGMKSVGKSQKAHKKEEMKELKKQKIKRPKV